MPTFEYQATATDGRVNRGRLFAPTLDGAAQLLAGQGLQVTKLEVAADPNDPLNAQSADPLAPVARPAPTARSETSAPAREIPSMVVEDPIDNRRSYFQTSVAGPLVGKVPLEDLQFFFRQMATMLEAGVPIVQTIGTIGGQSGSNKLKDIIKETGTAVEQGFPMSHVFQRYPEVFSPIMVSLVRAGEDGGILDDTMAQVADYIDKEIKLRNLYKRVTFMPKLQVGASVVVIIGANLIIGSINASANKLSSPLTTPATWLWLGPLLVFLFLFFRVGLANPAMKRIWDMMTANIPALKTIIRELAMAKFGRAFGALYRGGVPLTRCMQLAADACGNEHLRAQMYPAVRRLESGDGITETFRETGAFNPLVIDMVGTGETTGNLDMMLQKMSDFYEDDAEAKAYKLGQFTGIVVGLCVAVYIGYIVISFWVGYYGGIGSAAS
ncbi:type II secretion system F family protein [bacterium]|nr:MAG: type II secretion system F family protein [bacterium]